MRICFFHAGFSQHGGIERVASILVRSLSKKENIEIHCLSLNFASSLDFYSIPSNVKVDYLFENQINMKKAFIKGGIQRLVKYLKNNKIDVIVACGVIYFPLACISAKLAGVRVISWEHTNPACKNEFALEGLSRSIGARFSDMNVLISQEAMAYYKNHFRKRKNTVIYNPADNRLFETEDSYQKHSKKLISVGRLAYQKNFQILIDIAEKLLTKHEDWNWHIYGDGEQRAELESLIFDKGLVDRVVLMGNVTDIYERYNQYAAIVMTSRWEGFPMVLIEAAAKGLPMVSFDISTGPKEIIDDGVNGFLVLRDDVDGMVAKLETLINDDELRNKFSASAKHKARSFCVDDIANQWCTMLEELLL